MARVLLSIGMIVGAACIWLVLVYNRLVRLRNRYYRAFSQIDVQLKRRHDLIPNVVDTAKGYIKHERGVLEAVSEARSNAIRAVQQASTQPGEVGSMRQLNEAEVDLSIGLGRLLLHWEAYPELKANVTMVNLMEELTTTENRIALARQAYNDEIMGYNTALQRFPTSLVAAVFGFAVAEYFLIDNAEDRSVPNVHFSASTEPASES